MGKTKVILDEEEYTYTQISEKFNISRESFRHYFEGPANSDPKVAIKMAQDAQKKHQERLVKYEWQGEPRSLSQIAKMEGISSSSLSRNLKRTNGDIKHAIEMTKEKIQSKIMWDGKSMTFEEIGKKEGVSSVSLKIEYEKEKQKDEENKEENKQYDNYMIRALETVKNRKRPKMPWKDEMRTRNEIARMENISVKVLNRFIEKYPDVDIKEIVKMVKKHEKMVKIKEKRRKRVHQKKQDNAKILYLKDGTSTNMTINDWAMIVRLSVVELKNMLDEGKTIEEIAIASENEIQGIVINRNKRKIETTTGESLLQYCINNKLNYSVIYRYMTTYNKTLEEAEEAYRINGQHIPSSFIYEKYGLLLKHIMLNNNIDKDAVVRYMRDNWISMEEAVQRYIIRRNVKNANIDISEDEEKLNPEWITELFNAFEGLSNEEYEEFKKEFGVTDKEEECVKKSYKDNDDFKRKMDLYHFARAIEQGNPTKEELPEYMRLYEITPEEIEIIFLDLYEDFAGKNRRGYLLGKEEIEKKEEIKNIIKIWSGLSDEEKQDIIFSKNISEIEQKFIEKISSKIEEYKAMLEMDQEKENADDDILNKMRQAVGKHVGSNRQTRQELYRQMSLEEVDRSSK